MTSDADDKGGGILVDEVDESPELSGEVTGLSAPKIGGGSRDEVAFGRVVSLPMKGGGKREVVEVVEVTGQARKVWTAGGGNLDVSCIEVEFGIEAGQEGGGKETAVGFTRGSESASVGEEEASRLDNESFCAGGERAGDLISLVSSN